jgi:ubiquitin C-terminal hydrolase
MSTSNSTYGSFYKPTPGKRPKSVILGSSQPLGLENLNNTCYISAILQILFLILPESPNWKGRITQQLFRLKAKRDHKEYREFKSEVEEKIPIVKGWQQQDAQ